MKILFLCTRLAGYFINCIQTLKEETNADIVVIHWPADASAPFDFQLDQFRAIDKSRVSATELKDTCLDFSPQIVYVGGWVDKDYLVIAKNLRAQGAVVVGGIDNPWNGTLKQVLSSLFSKWIVRPYFDFLWVAGNRQYQFAQRLGYSFDRILTEIYVADIDSFSNKDKVNFSKSLIFVGRIEYFKGVTLLLQTFNSLTDTERNGWTLRMIGSGSLRSNLQPSKNVTFEEFRQPDDLASSTRDAGGFILPSLEEPWGVVVQEFAAAGLPLILSSQVNAREKFLIHNYNGFEFESGNMANLKAVLIKYFQLETKQLRQMGQRSHELAFTVTPQLWSARLMSVLKANHS